MKKKEFEQLIRLNLQFFAIYDAPNLEHRQIPTGSDFWSCQKNGYAGGVVACHDGKVYYYETGNMRISAGLIDETIEKYRLLEYNDYHKRALDEMSKQYGIVWKEL